MLSALKRPTWRTVIFLSVLYLMAIFFRANGDFIVNEALRAGVLMTGFGLTLVIGWAILKHKLQPDNIIITWLILLLLADPTTPLWQMLALGVITGLTKILVRINHLPVFNPAAAGLLASGMIFGLLTTWWGVSYSPRLPWFNMSITNILIIPFGIYVILAYRKFPTLFGVPLALAGSYLLQTGRLPLTALLEGTFAFFLLIMATEPKTTPQPDLQELVYALGLGGLLGWMFVHRIVFEPYLAALLATNLLFAIYKVFQFRFKR